LRVLGIIAEYNPFHNGHLYHIQKAKALSGCDYVIVVMSGQFVQRGEPAVVHKFARAKAALLHGADLVLELPYAFATASAAYFALGAATLLDATGLVDTLAFGSESGDLTPLRQAARILTDEPALYKAELRRHLDKGLAFPAARAQALTQVAPDAGACAGEPNNILGIAYLTALEQLKSPIRPLTLARVGSHYHEEYLAGEVSSATAIRKALRDNSPAWAEALAEIRPAFPAASFETFAEAVNLGLAPVFTDGFSDAFHYALRRQTAAQLGQYADVNEGLENRLIDAANHCYRLTDIARCVKTKRYTHTAVQRAMLHVLLGLTKDDFNAARIAYIRVLGFQRGSARLLAELQTKAKLPVIVNLKKDEAALPLSLQAALQSELRVSDLYYLATPSKKNTPPIGQEYREPIIVV